MSRFFIENEAAVGGLRNPGEILLVTGEDALHITKSLRMLPGEQMDLCDGKGTDYRCEIVSIGRDTVEARIRTVAPSESEPDVKVTLYASVTKGERMDFLVQKSVELGVHAIVPVLSKRCIYQADHKSEKNKRIRWNKIALEASKQCGRGMIPEVMPFLDFDQALVEARLSDLCLIAYERELRPFGDLLESCSYTTVSLFTGPEGGYEEEEIRKAEANGATSVSLGKRILRAETAPLYVLPILHYQAERNRSKH